MKSDRQKIFTMLLFTIYMLLLAGVILFKLPFYSDKLSEGVRNLNLIPFYGSFDENGKLLLREIIQNILIFVPFGIYISILKTEWPFSKTAISIIALSLFFEAIQFIFAIGRCDITDIIDNTAGGLIGVGIYTVLQHIFKNKTVKIILIFALGVTVIVLIRFSHLFYLSHFVMRRAAP